MKGLSPFPPFHDYQKYIPVKCTPRLSSLVPKTWRLCFFIRTYLALQFILFLHIIPSCLQFIIHSYYSFHCNLQFTVDMEWGSLFSEGITFFHVQLKKVIHFYCSRTMGVTFFQGSLFFTTPASKLELIHLHCEKFGDPSNTFNNSLEVLLIFLENSLKTPALGNFMSHGESLCKKGDIFA